ncbi:MAG: adenine phosphoribosyltransferase [Planctomycetota bacterium]
MDLQQYIRDVKDFPKPGIVFKDITPLLAHPAGFKATIDQLRARVPPVTIDVVAGIEARGFIFGAALARDLGVGFVPIRKPGKLPADTIRESYQLEYGSNTIEMHKDAITRGQTVLVADDVLATGGTLAAACRLMETAGAKVAACIVVIDLAFLHGRDRLKGYRVESLLAYS